MPVNTSRRALTLFISNKKAIYIYIYIYIYTEIGARVWSFLGCYAGFLSRRLSTDRSRALTTACLSANNHRHPCRISLRRCVQSVLRLVNLLSRPSRLYIYIHHSRSLAHYFGTELLMDRTLAFRCFWFHENTKLGVNFSAGFFINSIIIFIVSHGDWRESYF